MFTLFVTESCAFGFTVLVAEQVTHESGATGVMLAALRSAPRTAGPIVAFTVIVTGVLMLAVVCTLPVPVDGVHAEHDHASNTTPGGATSAIVVLTLGTDDALLTTIVQTTEVLPPTA